MGPYTEWYPSLLQEQLMLYSARWSISALITSDLSGLTHRGAQGWTFTAKSSVTGHKEKSGQSFALQQVEETKKPADANQRN